MSIFLYNPKEFCFAINVNEKDFIDVMKLFYQIYITSLSVRLNIMSSRSFCRGDIVSALLLIP